MSVWCVLLAAGRGSRSGLKENKVFFKKDGRSVLSRCLDAISDSGVYDGVVLVLAEHEFEDYRALTAQEGDHPIVRKIIAGGSERRDSAMNGLKALPEDTEIVSIHDAARPFVTKKIMEETVRDAREFGSGVISTPVTDTIKQIDAESGVVSSLDRSCLRAVQTPQTFRYSEIMRAYAAAEKESITVTDDAALYEWMYGNVHLSQTDDAADNVKLTLPGDFKTENNMMDFRVGQGYDAHRLKEGRALILCGVDVPHSRGLDGHSDADVAVHALMDAILGALAAGDIGHLFPDSDAAYKGISSMLLLKRVMELTWEKGYRIGNADVTIVAQKPKLAPYIDTMKKNLAEAMHVDESRINVKATTTERMGFEGEEIGISSQAAVLLISDR